MQTPTRPERTGSSPRPASLPRPAPQPSGPVPIAGRQELARRLRINGLLLGVGWVASRSTLFRSLSSELAMIVPAVDGPLRLLELTLFALLAFNIAESIYALNSHKSSAIVAVKATQQTPGRFLPPARASPFGTPQPRSSPKTRGSPGMSPSPGIVRNFAVANSPTVARLPLKPSPSRTTVSPSPLTSNVNTPIRKRSMLGNSTGSPRGGEGSPDSGALTAFMARHSPVASSLHRSISDRQSIDRLLEGE